MDICNRFGVDGQCSLYITGIKEDYTCEEIANTFTINGTVSKVVKVPDEQGEPEGRVLLQYASDMSISKIDPITLGTVPSPRNPAVTWTVKTIRDVCQEEVGREIARRYLDELDSVAGISRAGFLDILQAELRRATPSVHSDGAQTQVSQGSNVPDRDDQSEPARLTNIYTSPASMSMPQIRTDENIFNPPEIQKVIVEHVLRNEPTTLPSVQIRMRTFSGRMPRPNGEVDYDAWRTQVDLLLADPSLNDAYKVRRILESLLSPAVNVVKPLGISSPPGAYITQLDSAFGVVEDGEDLFAAFLSSNQNSGEKPSAYLSRLHSLITRAISRGGASADNINSQLLRQFCRGCWDQSIIIGLQLEYKKGNPPPFPELLLMLRTEEDRRSAKLDRMKKHLGTTKATAYAHHIFNVPSYDCEPVPASTTKEDETSKLKKKVSELTKQVEKLFQDRKENEGAVKKDCLLVSSNNDRKPFRAPGMPRAWFCFKCGQDNHIAVHCSNEPNPTLVRNKNAELRERQDKFLAQQTTSPFPLN